MLSHKFLEALEYESAISLTSWAERIAPQVTADARVLAPAIEMYKLENDIALNDNLHSIIDICEAKGHHGYGIGFRRTSKTVLISTGKKLDRMKEKYPILRKVLVLIPTDLEQL